MSISGKHAEYLIQQLNVLLVDDNAFMRKLVRGAAQQIGVKTITEAGDGIAALEAIRQSAPDVIILDWEMPLLQRLRTGAHRAFARRLSGAGCSDHHAVGAWRTLAHRRVGQARRQ